MKAFRYRIRLQGIVQDQTAKSIVSNRGFHQTFSKNNQTKAGNFLSVRGSLIKRAQCRTNMQDNRIEFFYNYNGNYIGFDEFIVEMEISHDFRSNLIQILREVDFETYRVRVLDVDQKTKLIFENMPQLIHQQPDVKTFSSYWDSAQENQSVVHFPNLEQTSILITPTPNKESPDRGRPCDENLYRYTSIGPFVKSANTKKEFDQVHECLRVWSKLYRETNWREKYLATSGDKVAWLHFRIDPEIEW